MTRITYSLPVSGTAKISGDTDMKAWYMTIGKWIVELQDGFLIVRGLSSPEVVLKAEA